MVKLREINRNTAHLKKIKKVVLKTVLKIIRKRKKLFQLIHTLLFKTTKNHHLRSNQWNLKIEKYFNLENNVSKSHAYKITNHSIRSNVSIYLGINNFFLLL